MIDTKALRSKVLDLAIQGKLTEQLETDGTAEEISYANEIIHKEESYNYIVTNIYSDTYGECPDFLTVDDIIKMKEIVVNAKNKYVKNGLPID